MNILPKKRWHVRTKENIARVRKDEAEAAEKERQERLRIENADREARLNILKQKSKEKLLDCGIETLQECSSTFKSSEHINFFSDLEHTASISNKDHDKEAKEKKEEYEKQIGYLTYLGQDTNEALGKKNWYEVGPETSRLRSDDIKETYNKLVLKDKDGKPRPRQVDERNGEISWKAKQLLDPIMSFKKHHEKYSIKKIKAKADPEKASTDYKSSLSHKKHKRKDQHNEEERTKKIQKLREERLKREQQERVKTKMFLQGLNGSTTDKVTPKEPVQKIKPKYNSQFNPELARQNYR